jgi:hypothetical protein
MSLLLNDFLVFGSTAFSIAWNMSFCLILLPNFARSDESLLSHSPMCRNCFRRDANIKWPILYLTKLGWMRLCGCERSAICPLACKPNEEGRKELRTCHVESYRSRNLRDLSKDTWQPSCVR